MPELWSGRPVICSDCSCARVPVWIEDGWRLPVHQLTAGTWPAGQGLCPGSLTPLSV